MRVLRYPFKAMGSVCEVRIESADEAQAQRAAHAAEAEVRRLEAKFSRYRDDSLTSRINAAAGDGRSVEVDDETAGLLDYAATVHQLSGGLFDLTTGALRRAWDFKSGRLPSQEQLDALLPLVGWSRVTWQRPHFGLTVAGMEIDFGGVVKEYAADRAAQAARDSGGRHGFVELGGDIALVGAHADGAPWQIGVRDPRDPEKPAATIALARGAIASSGNYERYMDVGGRRYCHILDPTTGWPAQELAAVSVVADQCLVAGSASTVGMLKPLEQALDWLAGLGLPHLAIDAAGRIHGSLAGQTG
jgi:thiamine biosynthesis lipoprotein